MDFHLHDTKSCYTKILQVEHSFESQDVMTGDGRGQYVINDGHPHIHNPVLEMIRLDIVWRVVTGENYFMVTVFEPHRWPEIEGLLPGIVARSLLREAD